MSTVYGSLKEIVMVSGWPPLFSSEKNLHHKTAHGNGITISNERNVNLHSEYG